MSLLFVGVYGETNLNQKSNEQSQPQKRSISHGLGGFSGIGLSAGLAGIGGVGLGIGGYAPSYASGYSSPLAVGGLGLSTADYGSYGGVISGPGAYASGHIGVASSGPVLSSGVPVVSSGPVVSTGVLSSPPIISSPPVISSVPTTVAIPGPTITKNIVQTISHAVPYGVPVDRPIPIHIPKPYPVAVDRPVPVPVPQPYPVTVTKYESTKYFSVKKHFIFYNILL